jgi:MFS family permease
MGAINSYPQYRTYFGFSLNEGTPATGIVYAIYTIGNLAGSFFAGPASDFKGRKWGMFMGCIIIMLGTCVQGAHCLFASTSYPHAHQIQQPAQVSKASWAAASSSASA